MAQYYNVELTKEDWAKFREELVDRGLYFEPSGCGDLVHIEVKCTEADVEALNRWCALYL